MPRTHRSLPSLLSSRGSKEFVKISWEGGHEIATLWSPERYWERSSQGFLHTGGATSLDWHSPAFPGIPQTVIKIGIVDLLSLRLSGPLCPSRSLFGTETPDDQSPEGFFVPRRIVCVSPLPYLERVHLFPDGQALGRNVAWKPIFKRTSCYYVSKKLAYGSQSL